MEEYDDDDGINMIKEEYDDGTDIIMEEYDDDDGINMIMVLCDKKLNAIKV